MNPYAGAGQAWKLCLFLVDFGLKSAVLAALAWVVAACLRRASAATRHLVWKIAVYGVLCLPLLMGALPAMRVRIPFYLPNQAPLARHRDVYFRSPGLAARLAPSGVTGDTTWSVPAPLRAPRTRALRRILPVVVASFAVVWALVACVLLARMAIALVLARRLLRGCRENVDGRLKEEAGTAAASLGARSSIRVLVGRDGATPPVPMTIGFRRPVVLLPAEASNWTSDRLQAVLRHEIAHVERADWLTRMAANIACALAWFNPLVWFVARRLRTESEYACDDVALSSGVPAPDYAQHLLALARALRVRRLSPILVTMAHQSEVRMRLQFILSGRCNRRPVEASWRVSAVATAVVVLLPLSAWRTIASAARQTPTSEDAVKFVEQTQLPAHFTVRYSVVKTFVNTPETIASGMRERRAENDAMVAEGKLSRAEADARIKTGDAAGAHGVPTDRCTMTISASGGKLRFDREGGSISHSIVYDGARTATVFAGDSAAYVYDGFGYRGFQDMPIPGVGLPGIPLARVGHADETPNEIVGQVYSGYPSAHGPDYSYGKIEVSASPTTRVKSIAAYNSGTHQIETRWTFSDYILVDSTPVASTITRTDYAGNGPLKDKPWAVVEYTLVSANLNLPPDTDFDLVTGRRIWHTEE